jgi:hypothetical protein
MYILIHKIDGILGYVNALDEAVKIISRPENKGITVNFVEKLEVSK